MQINANSYQPNVDPASRPSVQGKSSAVFAVDLDNSGTVSKEASKDIWAELGSKYNIRQATFDELCEIADTLYSNGQISFSDLAMMTFDWKRAADDLRKDYPDVKADFNQVPADSHGRRDWVAEFLARAKQAFSQGNDQGFIRYQRLADMLRQINQKL